MRRKLSKTKLEIMELLWSQEDSFGFSEIMEYFVNEKNKNWKKQTLSTFLRELISDGFIQRGYQGRNAFYTILISKEQYELMDVTRLVEKNYHGSVTDFVTALLSNYTISEEEKEQLIAFLKEQPKKDESTDFEQRI